jgi:hypothetical protein
VCVCVCVCVCLCAYVSVSRLETEIWLISTSKIVHGSRQSWPIYSFCARNARSMFARQLVSLQHLTAGNENNMAKRKFYEAFCSSIPTKLDENSANLANGKCE